MFHKSYINDFVMKKYNGTRGYLELLKINISTTFEKNDFFCVRVIAKRFDYTAFINLL